MFLVLESFLRPNGVVKRILLNEFFFVIGTKIFRRMIAPCNSRFPMRTLFFQLCFSTSRERNKLHKPKQTMPAQ